MSISLVSKNFLEESSQQMVTQDEENSLTDFCYRCQQQFQREMLPSSYKKFVASNYNEELLTIQDFKPEYQQGRLDALLAVRTENIFKLVKDWVLINVRRNASEKEKIAILQAEGNRAFFEDLRIQAEEQAKISIQKIANGAKFSEAYLFNLSGIVAKPELVSHRKAKEMYDKTFKGPDGQKAYEKRQLMQKLYGPQSELSSLQEKKITMTRTQFIKNWNRKSEESSQKYRDRFADNRLYLFFLSSKLGKNLNQLTIEEIQSEENKHSFAEYKERKRIEFEAEIAEAYLPQPIKPKDKKKKKSAVKNRDPVKETTQLSKVVETVVVPPPFFPLMPHFEIAEHVYRWFKAKDPIIRNRFFDKVGGARVLRYASVTQEELEKQKVCHRLLGVNRLMSMSTENLNRFSRPYQFNDDGKLREGRCFLAELKNGSTREQGMIYVGIDGNRIYHAHFVPFSNQKTLAEESVDDICIPLDGFELPPGEKWEMQGGYNLIHVRNKIIWTIGDNVQFEIQALS